MPFPARAALRRIGLLLVALVATAAPIAGQRRNIDRQLRDNRDRLEEIRRERQELEAQLTTLRNRARDINSELRNLDRQRTATSRLVNELDRQMSGLTSQVDTITFELILASDAAAEKQAVLERRITEIYKRGPLWSFEVLLAAESFGDLLSRYKYLYLVSRQDRQIKAEIQDLRDRIATQRRDLLQVKSQVSVQREERDRELQRYAQLERQRQRALANLTTTERTTATRLDSLARDEERLNNLITSLENARRAAIARGGPAAAANMTREDLGTLDWPVDGEVVYEFGRQPLRDGTSIRYQGVGIEAPVGTPVRAVRAGIVGSATRQSTWGPTVIIDHGAGYYTVYAYLSEISVLRNQRVLEGEIIGLSGGAESEHGPHIEFQIRETPEGATTPLPLDPLNWLRRR